MGLDHPPLLGSCSVPAHKPRGAIAHALHLVAGAMRVKVSTPSGIASQYFQITFSGSTASHSRSQLAQTGRNVEQALVECPKAIPRPFDLVGATADSHIEQRSRAPGDCAEGPRPLGGRQRQGRRSHDPWRFPFDLLLAPTPPAPVFERHSSTPALSRDGRERSRKSLK
jgi:hypothetical protein